MNNLLLTIYGDVKKLMKLMLVAAVLLSCVFAYADKQRIAELKAEARSEQSPVYYMEH